MGRRNLAARRTRLQVMADEQAAQLSRRLGALLRDARTEARLTQAAAGRRAAISQGAWSGLERGAAATIGTWSRAAHAVGSRLDAHIKRATATDQPRDAVHLRHQELVIRIALGGGWRALPEQHIDRDARTSRSADVLLARPWARPAADEYALVEVWDWFVDVGAAGRDWHRRLAALERFAVARMRDDVLPRHSGVWVVRATLRNRRLVADHATFFRSLFPGSGREWLAALSSPVALMPGRPALVWVSVDGTRLFPARLGAVSPGRQGAAAVT
jgi:transcriptional regulator with XRE-family HTH domain